jgi:hypothetical protein
MSYNSKSRLVIALVGLSSLLGCLGCWNPNPNAKRAREIIRMPSEQRRQVLASLPPGMQVDIYIYASTNFEPPFLLYEVAPNWKLILPVVKERLSTGTDDLTNFQLLWLLVAISESYCSLTERQDVLNAASQAVARMGPYKAAAQEPLRRLNHTPANHLPTCE